MARLLGMEGKKSWHIIPVMFDVPTFNLVSPLSVKKQNPSLCPPALT